MRLKLFCSRLGRASALQKCQRKFVNAVRGVERPEEFIEGAFTLSRPGRQPHDIRHENRVGPAIALYGSKLWWLRIRRALARLRRRLPNSQMH